MEDQVAIEDKIDSIIAIVTSIMVKYNINKIQDLTKEIKKTWAMIEETQEFGLVLNSRQKLFKMPVVPFERLTRIVKEFEPYKNFWLAAAGYTYTEL